MGGDRQRRANIYSAADGAQHHETVASNKGSVDTLNRNQNCKDGDQSLCAKVSPDQLTSMWPDCGQLLAPQYFLNASVIFDLKSLSKWRNDEKMFVKCD
jgi:hypothetical protein